LLRDDEGTEGKIAATHDAPAPRRRSAMALLAGVGALFVAAGVAAVVALSSRGPGGTGATASPTAILVATASSAAVGGSSVAADEVVLQVVADTTIERISAPGIHTATLDGTHARLVVARWGGELDIDAVLVGGGAARAVARSDGPRQIALATVAPPAVPDVATSAAVPIAPPPSARSTPRVGHPAAPPAKPGSELHANPYGP
jgi:hypothetical protein